MNLPQTILLVVIVAVSTLLVIIGIQIIGLLKEAKKTLANFDKILEDAEFLTHNLTSASSSLTHISDGLKSGLQIVGIVSDFFKKRQEQK